MRLRTASLALALVALAPFAVRGQAAEATSETSVPAIPTPAPDPESLAPAGGRLASPGEVTEVAAELAPPSGCGFAEVSSARDRFQRATDRKAYGEARDLLAPVIERCGNVIEPLRAHRMRNDLAVTLNQLRDPMGCLETLVPLIPLARQRDADILGSNPRFEGEELVKIAQTTRTNLRLCAGRAR
jgi:hypothetical protein